MKNTLLAAFLLAATAPFAAAGPMFFVQAQTQVQAAGHIATPDTGQVQAVSATTGLVGFDVIDTNGTHRAHIDATAALGHLFGSADAFNQWNTFILANDATTNLLKFFDTVTVNSASLPAGTPISITFTMVFTDTLTSNVNTCCSNADVVAMGLTAGDQSGFGNTISHTIIKTAKLIWNVGSANSFSAVMDFDAGSAPGVNNQVGGSTVNADVRFYLDPDDPTVTLTSAGGVNYSTPRLNTVPEPGTAYLLLAAIGAFGAAKAAARHRWCLR